MIKDVKIKVKPEGREGVYLVVDKDSLKDFIRGQGLETIHNFIGSLPSMVIGADHGVDSVMTDIDAGERIAVLTGNAQRGNLGHALAIADDKLEMYDIGEVTEENLEVVKEAKDNT